jgi:hypothetical protein
MELPKPELLMLKKLLLQNFFERGVSQIWWVPTFMCYALLRVAALLSASLATAVCTLYVVLESVLFTTQQIQELDKVSDAWTD